MVCDFFNTWSTAITALSTIFLAILTGIYVWLTKKILSQQTDPCVVLYVALDFERPSIIQLIVKNIGYGLAKDIRFEFSEKIPDKAWGTNPEHIEKACEMESGALIDGIPALVPGEYRRIDWGQYHGLKAALLNKKIIVICKFKKNTKEMQPTISYLEIESFANCATPELIHSTIATNLGLIAKQLEKINSLK